MARPAAQPLESNDAAVADPSIWRKLRYELVSRHAPDDRYMAAYDCWKEVWEDTFLELDGIDRLFSDDFTRQDELGALFHEGQCIGLTGYRFIDLSRQANRDDSYFKVWPGAALDQLTREGSRVCVGSNLTVRREWRGRESGASVKQLLILLSIHRFLDSDADVLAGTMRNGRGMDRLAYEHGACALLKKALHHGVEVDLIAFYRSSFATSHGALLNQGTFEQRLAARLARGFNGVPPECA